MLEQTDLETVYNHYVNAYLSHYHTTKHWSEFNDFRILRSLDGLSAVYFSPETVLFGTEEQRIAEAAVAKSIAARLIECMAYFLAQNISVNDIPNTLKISLAICHSQTHWTGIEINVSSFKDAYMDILNFCKDYLIEFDPADEATILHNRAKNAIYNKLGILLEKVIESDVIPDEAQKALSVVNYFSSHSRLTVKHFDSLNSNAYFERVTRSLQLISNLIHLEKAPCSQQIGNTCGDHDVYNLFISGIMGITPIVNGIGAVNSNELRKLADCKDNRKASEFATTIIENVKQLDKNTPDELAQIRKANDAIAEIGHYVCNLIHQLERLDISKVTAIVHSAASVQAHKNKYLSVEMNQSQRELFQELTTLFQGGHHIFAKCDLPQELHIPYGLYAENFALETCVGIEQQIILNVLEKIGRAHV